MHNPACFRITWQIVVVWVDDRRPLLFLLARCEPDWEKTARMRSIRHALSHRLPPEWLN
jgi:hypothetical protein